MADLGNIGRVIPFPKVYTMYPNFTTGNNKFGVTFVRVAVNLTGGTPNIPISLSLNGLDVSMILRLSASGSITIYDLNDGTWYAAEQGNGATPPKNIWQIVVSGASVTVTRTSNSLPASFSYT